MTIKLGKYFKVSPFFFLLAIASYFGGYLNLFLSAYICALLHETAHIIAAKIADVKIAGIEILPFGVCGRLSSGFIKSPYKEMFIASAGPLCSFCLSLLSFLLGKYCIAEFNFEYLTAVNAALVIVNLLPSLPLDGGRIMRAILTCAVGGLRAYNIMIKISRIVLCLIIAVSAYTIITADFNLSLILIIAFLLGSITQEQKNISLMTLREILYNKQKLEYDSPNKTCRLAAMPEMQARKLLKVFTYNKYYIIDVIDNNSHVIKTLTETEVISGIIDKGIRIKIGDI